MTKHLLLILSAFSALVAAVHVSDTVLTSDLPTEETILHYGIGVGLILMCGLVFTRWRYEYRPDWSAPVLFFGAAGLIVLAVAGPAIKLHGASGTNATEHYQRLLNVIFLTQGVLVFVHLYRDSKEASTGGRRT